MMEPDIQPKDQVQSLLPEGKIKLENAGYSYCFVTFVWLLSH